MTFKPQYSHWGREDFSSSGGAEILNPGEFNIVGGITTLLPTVFTDGTHSFNAPWDPVTGWDVTNSLDSDNDVKINLVQYESGGEHGNIGTTYNTAYYTSGDSSCIVYNLGDTIEDEKVTFQVKARAIGPSPSGSLDSTFSGDSYRHGLYIGDTGGYAFIEVLPHGLRVDGHEQWLIPGDFHSSLSEIRVVKDGSALSVMTDDGDHTYFASGFNPHATIQSGSYVAFGSFPEYGAAFTGNRVFHGLELSKTGFVGLTLWDDFKIVEGEAVSKLPDQYIPAYPVGTKRINTAPWYPAPSLSKYLGAYVSVDPITGGTTTLNLQYSRPTGNGNDGEWTVHGSVSAATVPSYDSAVDKNLYFFDLTEVPVYSHPFSNKLRFVIESSSNGGAAPTVDDITFVGIGEDGDIDVVPNWKLSAVAKEINVVVDKNKYNNVVPKVHHQDEFYFHNESDDENIPVGIGINPTRPGGMTGDVRYDSTANSVVPSGLHRINDGIYGSAWRPFCKIDNYLGSWRSNSTNVISLSGQYKGEALDIYSPYPTTGHAATIDESMVTMSVDEYLDLDNNLVKVQNVLVAGYTGSYTEHLGVALTGVMPNTSSSRQMGVIEGVIQIPRGPGVNVSLHEHGEKHTVWLDGTHYRQPSPFSCAAYYTGDFSSNNRDSYISIGAKPRLNRPMPLQDEFGEWRQQAELHASTEFRVFAISGYIADHSYVAWTGADANFSRTPEHINNLAYIHTGDSSIATIHDANQRINDLDPGAETFDRLRSNATVFEGWFRPFGLKKEHDKNSAKFAYFVDNGNQGLRLDLDRDGKILGELDVRFQDVSSSITGYVTKTVSFTSNENSVRWGNWNHIGVVLENKYYGDGDDNTAMPLVPTPIGHEKISHGARASRVYLEVNGAVVGSVDAAGDAYYGDPWIAADALNSSANIPGTQSSLPILPRVSTMNHGGDWDIKIGEEIFVDFDHVRCGVHDKAELVTDLLVKGSKDTAPLISPSNAVKPPTPVSGSFGHAEFAHIYRLDEEGNALGLDWGFSTTHLNTVGTSADAHGIDAYEIDSSYWLRRVDGPYSDRSALRIGPGARLEIPYNSFDERIFNGTGSYYLNQDRIYDNKPHLDVYYTGERSEYLRHTANSCIRMGAKFNLKKIPEYGVMDLMSFDMDDRDAMYGDGQAYLGINSGGHVVAGTRFNYQEDYGPLVGTTVATGEWIHLGVEMTLPDNRDGATPGLCKIYYNGTGNTSLVLVGQPTSHSFGSFRTYPFGYGGGITGNESTFRLGGDIPRAHQMYQWSYRWGDFDVCDWVVGYKLHDTLEADHTGWRWDDLASDGDKLGLSEIAVVDDKLVNSMSGIGYCTGRFVYPETTLADAGEKMLWVTANGGNDYAGVLRAGMPLFDNDLFMNAESYYALYENDNAQTVLGSTDSPIQLGYNVPLDGVNLALVNIPSWKTEESVTSFDLSDQNPSNLTPKIHGDIFSPAISTGESFVRILGGISSDDIRVSSLTVFEQDNPNVGVGYFMHLIGGEQKGVYIENALKHADATGDLDWYSTLNKVDNAISFTRSNGNTLSFDEFPYRLLVSTCSHGGGTQDDSVFTVVAIAENQSIGETVFINYPSIDYDSKNINIQDREIYNPFPVMKRADSSEVAISGEFSTELSPGLMGYDVKIYEGKFEQGYKTDNQADL